MTLLLHSTTASLWHSIVHDAEQTCSIVLDEELEAYLVFLLARYTDKPELLKQVMAIELLQGLALSPARKLKHYKRLAISACYFQVYFQLLQISAW